jgi:hypothetical protein
MQPSNSVLSLPAALQADIVLGRAYNQSTDRGGVRNAGDRTFDARGHDFIGYLASRGIFEYNIAVKLTPEHHLNVLQAYLLQVLLGHNCQNKTNLDDQTLRGYLTSAACVITVYTGVVCTPYDPATQSYKRPQLHPFLKDIISQRSNWKEPKKKKETVTLLMYKALRAITQELVQARGKTAAFLSREYTVYDWNRITVFTGSRIAEYGQSAGRTGDSAKATTQAGSVYATAPKSAAAGSWAGQALAFIAKDFTFWDEHMCQLDPSTCLDDDALDQIYEIHIRFRFDKSDTNFTIRKYRRQSGQGIAFDLITAVINVFRRANILRIPAHEPLGQYRQQNGRIVCIRDKDVRDVHRMSCIRAYPNPNHYCRVNIDGLVSHSNRVTAALCLQLGGASIDEIAFRLRWKPGSVPTYLRECFNGIDTIMQKAISGAYLTL